MLLAVDAGNTNVVFALVEGRTIKARWRIATDPRRTADEYAVWLSQLLALEGYDRGRIDAVIIATTPPTRPNTRENTSGPLMEARKLFFTSGRSRPLRSPAGRAGRPDVPRFGPEVDELTGAAPDGSGGWRSSQEDPVGDAVCAGRTRSFYAV